MTTAQEDQKRVQEEIDELKVKQQEEVQELKTQHEKYLEQVKAEEKVMFVIYYQRHLLTFFIGTS